ncbi:spermine oxidase-like [Contarinia nasturtii]|uniref:spermine oxidase-like n=1 Tax=Contarinia nasturtii TaxID=265458 RepID=UPI0012D41424|nr:spermine oxidase-like [Contarinia nasturtii]
MEKQIVIIGAGASGVAAATKLVSNGFSNVTILEAGNRIGGRINTIPFGENVVDMGAQWCHGETGNVVYEMAKDKNLLAHSTEESRGNRYVRSNGEEIPMELCKKITALIMDIMGDHYEEERKSYGSSGNFYAAKFMKALESDEFKEVDSELAHECMELFQNVVNSIDGCDTWYELSTNYHEYEECEGDYIMNWKDKGYATVLDLMQNKIPDTQNPQSVIDVIPLTKFNKEVVKVCYNQPGAPAKITLKERCLSMFEPLLPLWKYNSIDGMMIGTVDKIFLEFDKPFWSENWEGFSCLWKLEQVKEVREDPVNGDWLEGISGFYPFNPLQPNVICGWITGKLACKMEEKSDVEVKNGAEKVLRMFLRHLDIPDAKKMVRSTWHSNPLFRGSYSHFVLKAEALETNNRQLAEPINDSNGKPVIQFAGEATSPKYFSNVHGAVDAGWRDAERLINLYK